MTTYQNHDDCQQYTFLDTKNLKYGLYWQSLGFVTEYISIYQNMILSVINENLETKTKDIGNVKI